MARYRSGIFVLTVCFVLAVVCISVADDKERKYTGFITALENLQDDDFTEIIIHHLAEYLRQFPQAQNVDEMHLKMATIYHDKGDEVESFFHHMQIVYFYPGSETTTVARDRLRAMLVQENKFKPIAERIDELVHPTTLDSTREAAFFTFLRDMKELRFEPVDELMLAAMAVYLDSFPDSPMADAVQYWRGEILASMDEPRQALAEYLKLNYLYDKSLYVTASKLEVAELFSDELGEHQKAILTLEEFLLEYPEDPQAAQAQYQIARINEKHRKKYLEAINAYKAVAQRYPQSVEAVPALFEAARLYENEFKEYDQAIRVYTEVVRDFPEDLKAPHALAEAARIYEKRLKDYSNAANVYFKVYGLYPESTIAAQSLYAAAEITEDKLEDYNKAIEYYRLVVDKYSGSKLAEKSGKRIEKLSEELAKQ